MKEAKSNIRLNTCKHELANHMADAGRLVVFFLSTGMTSAQHSQVPGVIMWETGEGEV